LDDHLGNLTKLVDEVVVGARLVVVEDDTDTEPRSAANLAIFGSSCLPPSPPLADAGTRRMPYADSGVLLSWISSRRETVV
jgi:hypothetical protein